MDYQPKGIRSVTGPYFKPNGRSLFKIIRNDGSRTTISGARYIMEQHLHRKLTSDEQVHHKDGDPTNDSIENLEVLTKESHKKKHPAEVEYFTCPICGDFFSKRVSVVKDVQETRGHAGPFCSRECAGIYSQS
jgi:hypothetical protein